MIKTKSKKFESNSKSEYPVMGFEKDLDWEKWLDENHSGFKGVWLKFYKKGSGKTSVNYAQALDVALCFGWIDGQTKSLDEEAYLQKFTPRRAKSFWSKRNIEHVERLTREGKMKTAGLKEVEAAKSDGRWEQAYDSPANMSMPEEFLKELSKNKKAQDFFKSLNKTNTYAIGWRLQTAKLPETKQKRIKVIIEMLARGEKFH